MRSGNLSAGFAVILAIAATPLACGDDENSPGSTSGSSGAGAGGAGASGARAGASATGGSGATAGETAGGRGGEEADGGTSGTSGTGGTNGTGGTRASGGSAGTGGRPTGGASGSGGEGGGSGASDGGVSGGGMSGGPGSGEGGKGGEGGEWTDEETARLRRICEKTRALNCNDYSRCEEIFRYAFFGAPYCGPLAEAMLDCLDTRATIEDFACFGDVPFVIDRGIENPCNLEYRRVGNAYCFG